jgi:hypothetical protein
MFRTPETARFLGVTRIQAACADRVEAVLKRAGAKNAQHYFLYSRSPIAVISTFSFQIREIEKNFLRAI